MNITRRTKTLVVPYIDVLNNLNMLFDGQVVINKKHLPIGCEVLSVHSDQRTHAFVFEIYNKEFDAVEHGRESPIMNDELQVQAFTLSKATTTNKTIQYKEINEFNARIKRLVESVYKAFPDGCPHSKCRTDCVLYQPTTQTTHSVFCNFLCDIGNRTVLDLDLTKPTKIYR